MVSNALFDINRDEWSDWRMAMTMGELADRVVRVIERMSPQDLASLGFAFGHNEGEAVFPGVFRYHAWRAVDKARSNPRQLVALANPVLAKAIGWEGAPLLTVDDLRT